MSKLRTPIFIIDDDRSFCRSLKRLLNARGLTADCFESAQSFLDSVPSGQEGIAVVDIHMPECDGFSLMDRMHDLHYHMPVIIITGQTRADSRDMAMQKGAAGFLQKPFGEASLLRMIEEEEEGKKGER